MSNRDIEFTLHAYGIAYNDDPYYNGDWIGDTLKSMSDVELMNLAQFFDLKVEGVADRLLLPDGWDSDRPKVFVSHTSDTKHKASDLAAKISTYGIQSFVAHEEIKVSKEWALQIKRALANCDALVAIIGPQFRSSAWCDQEAGTCLMRDVPIVSISENDPHGFLGEFQAIKLKPNETPADHFQAVIDCLAEDPRSQRVVTDGLVHAFRHANNFDHSKVLTSEIESKASLAPRHVPMIADAIEQNPQVREAWDVPDRITKVLKAHGLSLPQKKRQDWGDAPTDDIPF